MAKNRMLPFGYKVENGAVTLNEAEADAVRRIFHEYACGASYKAIAEALTADGISYTPAKPIWNKNMIARLLQNEDYLGTNKYPSILEPQTYSAARAAQKKLNYSESPSLRKIGKLLVCGECGSALARRIHANGKTRWYCKNDNAHIPSSVTDEYILDAVSRIASAIKNNPAILHPDTVKLSESALQLARLKNNIDELLEGEIQNEGAVKELIIRLATSRYDACDDGAAVATALQKKIEALKRESDADAEMIIAVAENIKISAAVTISLELKSGQIYTEGV